MISLELIFFASLFYGLDLLFIPIHRCIEVEEELLRFTEE